MCGAKIVHADQSFRTPGSVFGDGVDGGGIRRLFRRSGYVEDATRGGGVESAAFAQVFGAVEPSLLDAPPGLQDPEELIDGPSLAVSAVGPDGVLGTLLSVEPLERAILEFIDLHNGTEAKASNGRQARSGSSSPAKENIK